MSRLSSNAFVLYLALVTAAPTWVEAQTVELPVQGNTLPWRFTERKRIGNADGAEWETFQDLRTPVFRRNGDLYVLDVGNARVHVFDSVGVHRTSFGQKGDGPGEFGQAGGLIVTADDTIGVLDYARQGIHLFTPGGVYVRTHRLPADYEGISLPVLPHPRGGIVFRHQPRGAANAQLLWHRFNGSSTPLASVAQPQKVQELQSGGAHVTLTSEPPQFGLVLQFAMLSDGTLAYTRDVPYRLQLRAGERSLGVTRADAPRAVTEEDKRLARDFKRAELQRYSAGTMVIQGGTPTQRAGGLPSAVIDQIVSILQFAPVVPAIRELRADPAGQLWVQRNTPNAFGASLIDVLRPNGSYVGTLAATEMPVALGPSGLAVYFSHDDMGVQRIRMGRFR
ncbi:MAG: 6-bladed beta-propeller [Longimicrobiales bacterium]